MINKLNNLEMQDRDFFDVSVIFINYTSELLTENRYTRLLNMVVQSVIL